MKNSQEEAIENCIVNHLITIGVVNILSIVIGVAVYYVHILINEKQIEGIAAFGEYFGGIFSPTLAFFALLALLISILYQVSEFQKSIKQLKE